MIGASLLLAAELACFVLFFHGWRGRLRQALLSPGLTRPAVFRLRIARTLGWFGLSSLAAVLLLGRGAALVRVPAEFAPLAGPAVELAGPAIPAMLAGGLGGGTALGLLLTWWRRRRGKPPVMIGDFSALLPATRDEAWLALGAALAAGTAEEMFFRLALPLLLAVVTGSAVAAFAIATLLFGLAHRYQRWPGVVATTLAGAMFAGVYLASGKLVWAMALHVLIDVNALVLRPWAGGLIRRG